MPSLTLENRLIWFAHCPKAGGTSVERVLVDHFGDGVGHLHWGWDVWWKSGGWRRANPPNSPQHLIWEDALRALPRAPDLVFALVRHPRERLASEYRYQRKARRGTRLGRWLAHLPFSVWLRLMLHVARSNPYAFDNHLRPQCDFVPQGAEVFRLEDGMEPLGAWLALQADKTASALQLPHLLSSGDMASMIDIRDQALIGGAFGVDYERFGYAMPPRTAARRPFVDLAAWLLSFPVRHLERCGQI